MEASRRANNGRPGFARKPVLVTLTARHTGDLVADRRRIVEAWRKTRQWIHGRAQIQTWDPDGKRWIASGRTVGKFDYALVWEVTPGDGRGHIHAHAVALWPRFSWEDLAAEWKLAIDDEEANIDLKVAGTRGESSIKSATGYLAKYVTKGVDAASFTPELAAAVVDAMMGVRSVSTSHGFWLREPTCACRACRAHERLRKELKLPERKGRAVCPGCGGCRSVIERPRRGRREPTVWLTHGVASVVIVDEEWRWSELRGKRVEKAVKLDGQGAVDVRARHAVIRWPRERIQQALAERGAEAWGAI